MNMFRQERQQFFEEIDGFWHDLYNTEYALYDVKIEAPAVIQSIRQAAERIGHIIFKTAPLLRQLDESTLLQLGFPKASLSFIRLHTLPIESVIARLDLAVTDEEIKLLEINSDTPTFIKETFLVNGKICKAFSLLNPNEACTENLRIAIQTAVQLAYHSLEVGEPPNIVFTSHDDHAEDYLTTKYLQELYRFPSQYIPLHQLRLIPEDVIENGETVLEKGLYDLQGNKIHVLYRQTYPIEHLVNDEDPETKENVGQSLLKLVEDKELAVINPPSAFLLQSKAVLALIWGLHEERHSFYTEEEHEWIHSYFLPTYLEEDTFIEQGMPFVKKPSFGREGDTVEIYTGNGEKVEEDAQKTYKDSLPVYQQFIKLPETVIRTEQGKKTVHYMYGCFYVDGQASAIGIRAGRQITDNEAYFLPVGSHYEEDQS